MDKLFTIFLLCSPVAAVELQPVYRTTNQFITTADFGFRKLNLGTQDIAFYAVVTNAWPTGLVPIFAVELTNHIELRRRPRRGKENATEPLFFALPPPDEPEATKMAGRWEAEAIRYSGTKDYPVWELAVEGDQVSGRFDQNTDYRFAYLMGGTFRSNALELRVEYINDAYILQGTWHNDEINGRWRRADNSEEGPWQATRAAAVLPANTNVVNLYEWRRNDSRHYSTDNPGPEWTRANRPICRVWLVP